MSIQWTGAERAMARSAVGPSSLAWEQLSNEERERLLDRIARAIATSRLSRDAEIAALRSRVEALEGENERLRGAMAHAAGLIMDRKPGTAREYLMAQRRAALQPDKGDA